MLITMSIFLDSLLEPNSLNLYNQTRLNELKSYFNNIHYEVFIYPLAKHAEYEQQLNRGLLEAGIKPGLLFPSHIILFSKGNKKRISNHKTHLMQQVEKGEPVIIVGTPPADKEFDWIQTANFSLIDWPADSSKSLNQTLDEQLDLPFLENTVTKLTTAANNDFKLASIVDFFPSKQIAKRELPFFCEKEIKELMDSIRVLRYEIGNLTETNMELETEQLALQRKMLEAEKTQTHLLKEMTIHYPLLIAEMAMTVAVLLCHAPEVLTAFYKFYKAGRNKLYKFYGRYSHLDTSDEKRANEANKAVNVTSIHRTTEVLSDTSISTESGIGLSASNDNETQHTKKSFSKRKNDVLFKTIQPKRSNCNKKESSREADFLLNEPEANGLTYCHMRFKK